MTEFAYRPVTKAYDLVERIYFTDDQGAQENIDEVLKFHEPVMLFSDQFSSTDTANRMYRLTSEEREHIVLRLMEQYGVPNAFHSSILQMQTDAELGDDRSLLKPTSKTFAEDQPSLSELLEEFTISGEVLWFLLL